MRTLRIFFLMIGSDSVLEKRFRVSCRKVTSLPTLAARGEDRAKRWFVGAALTTGDGGVMRFQAAIGAASPGAGATPSASSAG